MSRKFIEDNGLLRGSTSELQTAAAVSGTSVTRRKGGAVPGSLFLHDGLSLPVVNVGGADDYTPSSLLPLGVSHRYTLIERFVQRPALNADLLTSTATHAVSNSDFEVLGGNASSDDVVLAVGGGVTLTTDGGANTTDSVIILPHLDTGQTAWSAVKWNTLDRVIFETVIKTSSSIDCIIWAGLKLTNVNTVADDNNQCYFRYAAAVNSGTWGLISSRSGTDTTTNSGVTVAVSTSYHLMIRIDGAAVPHFFINGVEYGQGLAALTANIDLIPYVGVIQATSSVAGEITCRGISISKQYEEAHT
jgi:hypothetical protein